MTLTKTIIDDTYGANSADGVKRVRFTISLTNPYTTGGETVDFSSWFKTKIFGATVLSVNPSVAAANAGIAKSMTLRGDTSSTSAIIMQFWNSGLSGTSSAGQFVDNTVANLSSTTFVVEASGY